MPRARPRRRPSGRRRPKARRRALPPVARALVAVALLAVLVAASIYAVHRLAPPAARPTAARPSAAVKAEPPAARPPAPTPTPAGRLTRERPERPPEAPPERAPAPEPPPLRAALPPPPAARPEAPAPEAWTRRPKVAIIIDDLGNDRHAAETLARLEAPLVFAILPFSAQADAVARLAAARRIETLVHQPMEPLEYPEIHPGPGALLAAMGPDELIRAFEAALDSLPHAAGVNNHMGSRLTALSEKMYPLFTVLKRRGLFFVDSRTTDETLCRSAARLFQVPFAERDVFLDHTAEAQAVRRQLRQVVRTAYQRGEAVAIGHPLPATLAVLKEMLPELARQVELVPVSRLARVVE